MYVFCTFVNVVNNVVNKIKLLKMPSRIRLWSRPRKSYKGKQELYIDLQYGRENRKIVFTGIILFDKDFNSEREEIKRSHPNYKSLREALKLFKQRIEEGEDKFLDKQITFDQYYLFIQGKSDFTSIDDYLNTEIKNTRKPVTYRDYNFAWKAFKLHLGIKRKIKFDEINTKLLKDFKRYFLASERSNNSFNSYVDKIRAIYNDAYENGVVFKELKFPRKYKLPKTPTEHSVCTFEEFKLGIERCKTHLQWESLVMWLLQFAMRGMYYKDFSTITESIIEKEKNTDDYKIWCIDDEMVVKHNRHKVKDRVSSPMYIRIDNYPTKQLFWMLKYSFAYRFWNTTNRDKVGDINDNLSIYKYDSSKNPEDEDFHTQLVNSYQKAIRNVLPNQPMKNARKAFKSIANNNSTAKIADLLIGHSSDSQQNVLAYNDDNYKPIVEKIYETHTKVLKEFKADELCQLLQDKLISLYEQKVVPEFMLGWCLREGFKENIYIYSTTNGAKKYTSYFKNYNENRFLPVYLKS